MTRNEKFAPLINEDIATLARIYEKWQFATYKPEGMDAIVDKILDVKMDLEQLID